MHPAQHTCFSANEREELIDIERKILNVPASILSENLGSIKTK